jgi:Xaa-Pro aminopeptidase
VGCEFSAFCGYLQPLGAQWIDIEPDLIRLRRRKEPDELQRIGRAIAATEAMYRRAREIIRAGICELELFSQLQEVAVNELGERLTGTGNDYQCGSPGGPPRAGRTAQRGELYILDLGPAYRGYFADNCRTVAVTEPTGAQHQAWQAVVQVLEHVEQVAGPGVSCRQLYQQAAQMLREAPTGRFLHHLGHGVGLFPHEPPHLNPAWDDQLEVGDVFTVEPGLYAQSLRAGVRIEDNYLVTADGVQRLSLFARHL